MTDNVCPDCGAEFKNEKGMKIHYGKEHGGAPYPWKDQSDGEFSCPSCDETFDTEKGRSIHHTRIHGEKIGGVTVECDWCAETTTKSRYQFERDDHHFCSRECSSQWRTENFTGENNPHWKGGKVTVECAWCEKELEIIQAKDRAYDVHFCSIECEGQWKSKHQSGENAPAWKDATLEVDCDNCGEAFKRYKSHVERAQHSFCSPDCRIGWMIENAEYEENHGPRWDVKRQKAIDHHGEFCQRCGIHQSEHHEEYGRDLSVHHIVPPDEFDDEEEAHHVENLRPLCSSCHAVIERSGGGFPVETS